MTAREVNELRKNPFDDEWTMYAANRARVQSLTDGARGPARACPFCPGAAEVGDGYEVCILPNRYPSFMPAGAPAGGPWREQAPRQDGYGRQDVFLFCDQHDRRLVDQPAARIDALLAALGARIDALYQDPAIESVVAFENSGAEFGPSIAHPHGQIFALPFVPKRVRQAFGPCALCRAQAAGDMDVAVIASRPGALLVCPPHARFPYEMHVFPRTHAPGLGALAADVRLDVAALVRCGLGALRALDDGPMSYMLLFYVAPRCAFDDYHLRIEILPIHKPHGGRKYLGGLELGYGVFVNPSIPEDSAALLRARAQGQGEDTAPAPEGTR